MYMYMCIYARIVTYALVCIYVLTNLAFALVFLTTLI